MNAPTITAYTIPAPKRSFAIYLLGVTVVIGVIALGLAAWSAFKVVNEPAEAFFKAMLIEVSAIAEAVALARAKRRRDYILPLLGMTVAVLVSGTYNYTQAAQSAGGKTLTTIELYAIALGPLAAVSLLALNFGKALRDFEAAVAQWLIERQAWFDSEVTKYNDAQRAEQLRLEGIEAQRLVDERKRADRDAERQLRLEALRLEHELKLKLSEHPTEQAARPVDTGEQPIEHSPNPTEHRWTLSELRAWLPSANGETPKNATELERLTRVPRSTADRWFREEVRPHLEKVEHHKN